MKEDELENLEEALVRLYERGERAASLEELAKMLLNEIGKESSIENIKSVKKLLVRKHWSRAKDLLKTRGFDFSEVVKVYMEESRSYRSIKVLAAEIAKDTGMNVQSVYMKLLFLAARDDEVGYWLRNIKSKRRVKLKDALRKLDQLLTAGVKQIPLSSEIIGCDEEELELLGGIISKVIEKGYKIKRRSVLWVLSRG